MAEAIPDGMMRVWDADQKKVILVPEPPSGKDQLTLTIRLYDPKEKTDVKLSASWVVIKVLREDLQLPLADFAEKYIAPRLSEIEHLKR